MLQIVKPDRSRQSKYYFRCYLAYLLVKESVKGNNLYEDLIVPMLREDARDEDKRPDLPDQKAFYDYAKTSGKIAHANAFREKLEHLAREYVTKEWVD